MSLNTSGSQQRPHASRYSSRCWYCKEFGHYRRNCPTYKSLEQADLGTGNAGRVSPKGQGGRLNESNVGATARPDVNNAFSQLSSKQEMTFPDMPRDRPQVKNNLRVLYVQDFIGGTRVMRLIDTGAARSILSFKIYNFLPASVKFSLSSANSAIALGDGSKQKHMAWDML